MSKYNAPVIKASPSLSTEGSELLAPKYLSSKSSKLFAAAVALFADAVAELALAVAELALAVAEFAAFVAEVVAEVLAVVAEAASTIKSYFAEFAFVVKGVEPDEVCAGFTIKIIFVEVSFTKSLAT